MASHEAALISLAHGLAEGAELEVVFHDSVWAWNPETRTLLVGRRELAQRSLAECAALIAHEVGHCAISRYLGWHAQLRPSALPGWLWPELLNALEDPRVEGWMIREFPGAASWFAALQPYALSLCDPANQPTWSLQFLLGSLHEWQTRWTQVAPVTGPVAHALDATREQRRAYAEALPQWQPPVGREARLHHSAWGIMALAWQVGERLAQLREAEVAFLARQLEMAPGWPEQVGAAVDRDDSASCVDLLQRLQGLPACGPQRPPAPESVDLATRLIRCIERQVARDRAPSRGRGVALTASDWEHSVRKQRCLLHRARRRELQSIRPHAHTEAQRIRLAAELRSGLVQLFPNAQFPRWQRGFATGRRLDLRVAMQLPADPRRATELWLRRGQPEKPDAAVVLLVDLSGSMDSAGKVQAAVLAASVLTQVLAELAIRCAVLGFQDQLIPIAAFGEPWTPQLARRIDAMALEAAGARPGGHNQPGHNDDGPCLLEAARLLLDEPARTRLLVVISDGRPSGARSGPAELQRAVAQLAAWRCLVLSAIGIGPGTDHVREFYPDAQGNVPVAQFPAVLCRTLLKRLALGMKVAG